MWFASDCDELGEGFSQRSVVSLSILWLLVTLRMGKLCGAIAESQGREGSLSVVKRQLLFKSCNLLLQEISFLTVVFDDLHS